MEMFAGKTPAERNKIIAAIVLGTLAVVVLFMVFGPSFRGKASAVTPLPSPSVASSSGNQNPDKFKLPSQPALNTAYATTPVVYNGVTGDAPETGRNIFAFYEPPPPTPFSPTPLPTLKPATPAPPPPVQVAYVMPQGKFAGESGFKFEVNGDKFTPETKIYFNQSQMPTTFISAQKLATEIPAALIANEGPKTVEVHSPIDSKLFSNQIIFSVQAPPNPEFQYIGMIARKRYNNDTAYFMEPGKQVPTAARLNDIVAGRFRLMSISAKEVLLVDVNLGFPHRLPLVTASSASSGAPTSGNPSFPGGFPPGATIYSSPYSPPGFPSNNMQPGNFPQQQQQQRQRPQTDKKDTDKNKDKDLDDDDTDN